MQTTRACRYPWLRAMCERVSSGGHTRGRNKLRSGRQLVSAVHLLPASKLKAGCGSSTNARRSTHRRARRAAIPFVPFRTDCASAPAVHCTCPCAPTPRPGPEAGLSKCR